MADTSPVATAQPYWRYKTQAVKSWDTTGNTDTITDSGIKDNSYIIVVPKSTTPAGFWAVTSITNGSATVTSSDSESEGLTYYYIIL